MYKNLSAFLLMIVRVLAGMQLTFFVRALMVPIPYGFVHKPIIFYC